MYPLTRRGFATRSASAALLGVLRVSLIATACALLSCNVDDYGNPAYGSGDPCATHTYRGFCVKPQDAAIGDARSDGATISEPSMEGAPCSHEYEERLCYDGANDTRAVGTCKSGVNACIEGRWTDCVGQVVPDHETCNGSDDDCDGNVDEGVDVECVAPGSRCPGHLACEDSKAVCKADADPLPEICNAFDDDCDDDVDEDADQPCVEDNAGCVADEEGNATCKGICAPGVHACREGKLDSACTDQVKPASKEHCEREDESGIDDDCDGKIDEGCACSGNATRACYAARRGAQQDSGCGPGSQQCQSGFWSACNGAGTPRAEACPDDQVDNDCNGRVDDVAGSGKKCVSSLPGRCHDGTQQCMGDHLGCATPSKQDEICNQVDDDCDGHTDEEFDLQADRSNCGACDVHCDSGEECCSGSCVDTSTDIAHCGSCISGCVSAMISCCDSYCVDRFFDRENCGTCGHVCKEEEVCCDGGCVPGMCMQL